MQVLLLPTPVEVQIHIVQLAVADLDQQRDSTGRAALLTACSLVCRAWKDTAQPLLFCSVDLKQSYKGAEHTDGWRQVRFFEVITARPPLGALVRSIELPIADVGASNRLLQLILFVPSLTAVKGLVWAPSAEELILPPVDRRPKLETLGVGGASVKAAWTVDKWFDLAELREFESTATDIPPVLATVLPSIPAAVSRVSLKLFEPADTALVLSALASRKQALTTVDWHPLWGRSREAVHEPTIFTLLAKFPAVREFTYSVVNPAIKLVIMHPTLEVLRIGTASGCWDPWSARGQFELANGKAYSDDHPLRQAVKTFCSKLPALSAAVGQPAVFPSLRALGLCPRWSRPLDFSRPECRAVPGIHEMARLVLETGLAFVDELGHEWQAEWSSAAAPAQATLTS